MEPDVPRYPRLIAVPRILLPSFYLPPVQYFCKLAASPSVLIESQEHFQKQTFRNRCHILSANGILALTIPVRHGNNQPVKMKEVRIAYDYPWQKLHFRSIESAYRRSPYFEYLEDGFRIFYEKKNEFLFDLNQSLLSWLLDTMKLRAAVSYTKSYEPAPAGIVDLRNVIHPKTSKVQPDPEFIPAEYNQVFSDRHPFVPNLSIMDLLFNQGPEGAVDLLGSGT